MRRARFAMMVLLIALAPALAVAQGTRVFHEEGIASTGFNRLLGVPIWTYPNLDQFSDILGEEVVLAGFNTAGAFDAVVGQGNGNSLPLTPVTPGDALLATHFDDIGMMFLGVSRSSVPDEKLNVPLDSVEVLVDDFGVDRAPIPCASETPQPATITRAAPCDEPVTLERWLWASGSLDVKCFAEGGAELILKLKNLLPNRLYTAWYVQENFAAGPEKLITGFPLGGVPNAFLTDLAGSATYERSLAFCPHDVDQALGVAVHLRSNGQNYGGVPVPFLNQENPATAFDGYVGLIPGTAINIQLSFNINGIPFTGQLP
jgi:hypothetical protein